MDEREIKEIKRRLSLLEGDVKYLMTRVGEILMTNPELAKRIGFALGKKEESKDGERA